MSLRLFDRIATLLRADAHGVVESLEERSLLLKQYVREAELDLNRKRAEQGALRDEEKRLRESVARREGETRALDEDITLALAGGKEDLARFAIRRWLPRRREAQALGVRIAEIAAESQALAERLAEQERQFESLRTRVRAEIDRATDLDRPGPWPVETTVAEEEVDLELMRRHGAGEGSR